MMYGLTMPVLFPIAMMHMVAFYLCERVMLAYLYKQPPQMDNKLFQIVLNILNLAPLVFVCNAFWMVDNKQIFANKWSYIQQKGDHMRTYHNVARFKLCWSTPLLFVAVCGIVFNFLYLFFQ